MQFFIVNASQVNDLIGVIDFLRSCFNIVLQLFGSYLFFQILLLTTLLALILKFVFFIHKNKKG